MIRFGCPNCDKALKIRPQHAGRRVACPRCESELTVPADALPNREADVTSERTAWDDYDERRRGRRRNRMDADELDMTPMVDVTFLLLIFFMVTASFQLQKSLPAKTPESDEVAAAASAEIEEPDEEPVIIEVTAEDVVFIDGTRTVLRDVRTAVAGLVAANRQLQLLLEIDREARHGTVVAVVDAAGEAGVRNVRRTSTGG